MERFLKRECYVVVHPEEWKAFTEMCDASGVKWSGRGCAISEYTPLDVEQGRPVRVLASPGWSDSVRLVWSSVSTPKVHHLPIIGFKRLRPIADKAVITSHGREVTARLLSGKRTFSNATATCSLDDSFRFGPGAMLALYRTLESEKDRKLALELIGNERIRQLEPRKVHYRTLVGLGLKPGTPLDAAEIANLLAKALSETFGVAVELATSELADGEPKLHLRLVASAGNAKEGSK